MRTKFIVRPYRIKSWQSLLPALVWATVIAFLLFSPGEQLPRVSWLQQIPHFDKWVHAGLFCLLTLLLLFGFAKQQKPLLIRFQKLFALAISLGYAGLTEFLQYVIPSGRTADIVDFLADAGGIILAFFVRLLWKQWHQRLLAKNPPQ